MKTSCFWIFSMGLWGWYSISAAQTLGKYQLILDKQLLGAASPPVQEAPMMVRPPAAPAWSQNYRMTMMTVDHRHNGQKQVRIGLENIPKRSAMLLLENDEASYPNFFLVDADFEAETAAVRHQGRIHTFTLQDGIAAQVTSANGDNPRGQIRNGGRQIQPHRRIIVMPPPTSP